MPTLSPPPTDKTDLDLWLQHAAGKLLLDATRERARNKLPAGLSDEARAAALQADRSSGETRQPVWRQPLFLAAAAYVLVCTAIALTWRWPWA